jgi:septal ring factor EnvC (AmiA/AmiB activator)
MLSLCLLFSLVTGGAAILYAMHRHDQTQKEINSIHKSMTALADNFVGIKNIQIAALEQDIKILQAKLDAICDKLKENKAQGLKQSGDESSGNG